MSADVQIRWFGKEFMVAATERNVVAMSRAGLMLEGYIKKHFTSPGSGRRYKKTKSGKYHRASKPFQPPAVDDGVLRASVGHDTTFRGDKILGEVGTDIDKMKKHPKFEAGTDVNYGLYLELGHLNRGGKSSQLPRPWLRPALKKNGAKIEKIFKDANK